MCLRALKSSLSSRVLYQCATHPVCLVGGNCTSQLHHSSSDSHTNGRRCLLIVTLSRRLNARCPSNADVTCCKTICFKEFQVCIPQRYMLITQVSLTSEKPACSQSWGQSGSPPTWGRIKDLSIQLDTDSHSSFDRAGFVYYADKPKNCSNFLLHSCSSSILHIPHLQNHTVVHHRPSFICPHCGMPLTHNYCKRIIFFP